MGHTDTPWDRDGLKITSSRGVIAEIPTPQNGGVFDCQENVEFIFRSCNTHDELVAALKKAMRHMIGLKHAADRQTMQSLLRRAQPKKNRSWPR